MNDYEDYLNLAKDSAQKNAKNTYQDYIGSSYIADAVKVDFKVKFEDHIPSHMISQISVKIIKKEQIVMASSGVYYDKDELKQLIASKKNAVCIITGKILTEKLEDF